MGQVREPGAVTPSAARCGSRLGLLRVGFSAALLILASQGGCDPPDLSGQPGADRTVGAPRAGGLWARLQYAVSAEGMPDALTRAKRAICEATHRDIAAQLAGEGNLALGPFGLEWKLANDSTGETFRVRERDGLLREWTLGAFRPPIEVAPDDLEAFERAFMRTYYPQLPEARMALLREPRAAPRTAVYVERVSGCLVSHGTLCRFEWKAGPLRLDRVRVIRGGSAPALDVRLTPEEACRRAEAFVAGWKGVTSASAQTSRAGTGFEWDTASAQVVDDDYAVQRAGYFTNVALTLTPRLAREWGRERMAGEALTEVVVCVDATTGACFPVWRSPDWPESAYEAEGVLGLQMPGGYYLTTICVYAPRRVGRDEYLAARFIESLIWEGRYTRDGNAFTLEYGGREWKGEVGRADLSCGADVARFGAAPREIEGEVYLPTAMYTRITGWRFSHPQPQVLQVDPPS